MIANEDLNTGDSRNSGRAGEERIVPVVENRAPGVFFFGMNRFLTLAVFAFVILGCRGPGGPIERAGRGVDNAVYNVGAGIKNAGQKIQRAAE